MYPAIVEIKALRPRHVPVSLLYATQKCRCFYCGRFMEYITYNDQRKKGYTVDHLFPRSKGYGKSGNIVLACRKCNEKKENRFPTVQEIVRAWEIYQQMGREFIATITLP